MTASHTIAVSRPPPWHVPLIAATTGSGARSGQLVGRDLVAEARVIATRSASGVVAAAGLVAPGRTRRRSR